MTNQLVKVLDAEDADGLLRLLSSNKKSNVTASEVRALVESVSKYFGTSLRFEATNAKQIDGQPVWIEYDVWASKGTGRIELLVDNSAGGWLIRDLALAVDALPRTKRPPDARHDATRAEEP